MNRPSDKKIIAALQATMGKVCLASERRGCLPDAIYARARVSQKVGGTIRFFRGKMLDAAETNLWQGILNGKSWAVRMALLEWGRSRAFSDGAEAWHSPRSADDRFPDALVRRIALEVLNHDEHVEKCRMRQLAANARPVCGE